MDDPESEVSKLMARQQVQARKVEKGTLPKLYYIEGDAASLNPMAAPPNNEMVQFSQAAGVGHFARKASKRIKTINPESQMNGEQADYEKESPEDYGVTIPTGGDASAYTKSAWKVVKENARRVHDAPAKGVLWGWELPAYLWSKAVAAGLFFVTALASLFGYASVGDSFMSVSSGLSLGFLVLTAGFLIKDLDRPDRFLYVILRPQTSSWLVKGGNILTVFGLSVALWIAGYILRIPVLKEIGAWAGLVLSIPLAGYTAFLLAQAKGRDFWQSPVLPLHMLVHSLLAGAAAVAILGLAMNLSFGWDKLLTTLFVGGIAVNLLVVFGELAMSHPSNDSKLAAKMIVSGKFAPLFYGGSLLVGNLLPLALVFLGGSTMIGLAGIMVMAGILVTEYIWVRAPQLVPLS